MKKISQKSLELLLLLLIVIIAAAAYKFGYLYYTDKADAVEREYKLIEAQIASLEEQEAQRETLTNGILEANAYINETLAKYGPGNTPEKTLAIMVDFEDNTPVEIPTLNFGTDEEFFVSTITDEYGNPRTTAYRQVVPFTFVTSYDGFKMFVDYINAFPERMNVKDFNIAYDNETDTLTGSMNLNLYSVQDEGHVYTDPIFDGISVGKDNIFE